VKKGFFFDWPTAMQAGRAGYMVRRRGWTTKWLRWLGGLWWLRVTGQPERVVKATDFGKPEFEATDWTHMPPECITEAESQTGQTCPMPFVPVDPGSAPTTPDGDNAGGNAGGLEGFAGGGVDEGEPPPAEFSGTEGIDAGGTTGGGSDAGDDGIIIGGGGGGGGGGGPTPRPPRAEAVWPSLEFGVIEDWTFEPPGDCYPNNGLDGPRSANFAGPITLTAPEGVVDDLYFVKVRDAGGRILFSGTMHPGDSADWFGNFTGIPCASSFGVYARAWGPRNAPDITASATTPVMLCYCEDEESSGEPVGAP
jgi:hypothetical protein